MDYLTEEQKLEKISIRTSDLLIKSFNTIDYDKVNFYESIEQFTDKKYIDNISNNVIFIVTSKGEIDLSEYTDREQYKDAFYLRNCKLSTAIYERGTSLTYEKAVLVFKQYSGSTAVMIDISEFIKTVNKKYLDLKQYIKSNLSGQKDVTIYNIEIK